MKKSQLEALGWLVGQKEQFNSILICTHLLLITIQLITQ